MAESISPVIRTFSWFDYFVLIAMLLISTFIGIYHALSGGKQKTTSEFLLADRTVHPVVSALSIVASFISGITMLGAPAETYIFGSMYWLYAVAVTFSGFITCFCFLPVYMNLEITSVFEYLGMRFDIIVRRCGVVLYLVEVFMYLGIVLYAPALALSAVAGISLWGSILASGIICTFYTSIGGMWAVLWTDVFQVIVMMAAFVSVIVGGCIRLGGMDNMWQIADQGGRIDFVDFRLNPTIRHTFWSITIGGGLKWSTVYCTNQADLQRCIAVGTLKRAQITVFLSIIGMIIVVSSAVLCGLTMYSYYADCDPLTLNLVDKSDQLIVYFIMELFSQSPGLPGFFTSGVFSAALSTLSASLNAITAVTIEDFVKPVWKDMSDENLTKLSKILVLTYGIFVILLAFVVSTIRMPILQLALGMFGFLGGPLLGLFSLGLFFPWTNSKGAVGGAVLGLSLSAWIILGAIVHPPELPELPLSADRCLNTSISVLTTQQSGVIDDGSSDQFPLANLYSVSYAWYSTIGCFSTILFGLLISFITGANEKDDIDDSLLSPLFHTIHGLVSKSPCHTRNKYDQHKDDETNEEDKLELEDRDGYSAIKRH